MAERTRDRVVSVLGKRTAAVALILECVERAFWTIADGRADLYYLDFPLLKSSGPAATSPRRTRSNVQLGSDAAGRDRLL
jgi:hypothetical protein